MEREWHYKNLKVKEGLKPNSNHFQYFFVVSEGEQKKCNYCVWIEDDVLSDFDATGNFKTILASHRGDWGQWVKEKIEQKDFRNVVLKFGKDGRKELDLNQLDTKLSIE